MIDIHKMIVWGALMLLDIVIVTLNNESYVIRGVGSLCIGIFGFLIGDMLARYAMLA